MHSKAGPLLFDPHDNIAIYGFFPDKLIHKR